MWRWPIRGGPAAQILSSLSSARDKEAMLILHDCFSRRWKGPRGLGRSVRLNLVRRETRSSNTSRLAVLCLEQITQNLVRVESGRDRTVIVRRAIWWIILSDDVLRTAANHAILPIQHL